MSGTGALTDALKNLLKSAGITYADAARALGLSEASVKRLFAERSFTLKRLETLCELAGADLVELVRFVDDARERRTELTETQEQALAGDIGLLLAAICVLNRYRFEDVARDYAFTTSELQQKFAQLDRLGIIELQPHNRYRLQVARGLRWRSNGPIERYFVSSIFSSFIDRKLIRAEDRFRFSWGTISSETAQRIREKLKSLADEFNAAADKDAQLPLDRRFGSGLMIAFRHGWEPADFARLRRETPPDTTASSEGG
jgi:transcriptional regulator with XRE-family HTH domain